MITSLIILRKNMQFRQNIFRLVVQLMDMKKQQKISLQTWCSQKQYLKKERSSNVFWYRKFPWLHYSMKNGSVFCYIYMVARNKGHKGLIVHSLFSGSTDPAFMARGFRNWKKSSECFLITKIPKFIKTRNAQTMEI